MIEGCLTAGITTRNRHDSLVRCVRSLTQLGNLLGAIIVFDDGSHPSVAGRLEADLAPSLRSLLTVLRDTSGGGNIVGRNRLVATASTPLVLLLDDDAHLIDGEGVRRAMRILDTDARVAVVGFAQADAAGQPWPADMQAAAVDHACEVPTFIGFAHLVRREIFQALGGYRAALHCYGEEKEYSIRLLEAGYVSLYLPDAPVAHSPDPSGRNPQRYLRYVIRNDCLNSLFNDPLPRLIWMVPVRLLLYFRMRRAMGVDDPGGLWWILRELLAAGPELRRDRRPVRWSTIRRWNALRRRPAVWRPPEERAC
jgi:GT2 family glycosyltransferase